VSRFPNRNENVLLRNRVADTARTLSSFSNRTPTQVFQMDLFNPVADQNDYGARDKMSKVSSCCVELGKG
jgi:hypothetical protein